MLNWSGSTRRNLGVARQLREVAGKQQLKLQTSRWPRPQRWRRHTRPHLLNILWARLGATAQVRSSSWQHLALRLLLLLTSTLYEAIEHRSIQSQFCLLSTTASIQPRNT